MKYVAHAGVKLSEDANTYEKGKWYYIKEINSIEYRWRFCSDLTYEVIAGVFDNKNQALVCAKRIYITLIYSLLKGGLGVSDAGCSSYEHRFFDEKYDGDVENYSKNENFFFWTPHYTGGRLGPGVFEVEDDIDQFEQYKFLTAELLPVIYDSQLEFDNVDQYIFTYNRESQALLNSVIVAQQAMDYGMKMTLYCGIFEHLSENGLKSKPYQEEIDELIKHTKSCELGLVEKDQLISYLNKGKEKSARQKCLELIERHAKPQYGKYTAKQVFSEAYNIRSAFSHGDEIKHDHIDASRYIKYVILDVIESYMREKESK